MIESFLITGRETLEASLVVGIVYGYLHRSGNNHYRPSVHLGIGLGILGSIITAALFQTFTSGFEGVAEQLFEGTTMLIGALLLSTMIIWMMRQHQVTRDIEQKVDLQLHKAPGWSSWGLTMLIATAILREGAETVLFLNAARYESGISFLGSSIGVLAALVIGYLFFKGAQRIKVSAVFKVSSVLLILFAAGLVSHSVHEFQEVAGSVVPLYDINPPMNQDGSYPLLHEKGLVGSFAKGLFGYNGNPSALELAAYVTYLMGMVALWKRNTTHRIGQRRAIA